MWVMIAGPYRSGCSDESGWADNLAALNRAAYSIFQKGHVPVVGVNLALPIIDAAGPHRYEDIMMPLSLSLADRCDAVLRIGGPSAGADEEVRSFERRGLPVFTSLDRIPSERHGADLIGPSTA